MSSLYQCAPYINTRIKRKSNKWINDPTKRKIEERRVNKTTWLNNKSKIESLLAYNDSKREVSKQIRNTKAN